MNENPSESLLELIERGSLGSAEAKAFRATVSPEEVERVIALARQLEQERQMEEEEAVVSETELAERIDKIIAAKDDPEDSHVQADLLFADLIADFCPKWVHDQLDRLGKIPNRGWYA